MKKKWLRLSLNMYIKCCSSTYGSLTLVLLTDIPKKQAPLQHASLLGGGTKNAPGILTSLCYTQRKY